MVQHAFALPGLARGSAEIFREFPTTRYQGSKRKLLPFLHEAMKDYEFSSVLDLYSGTCSVGLMFRSMGKSVTANDYMLYNWTVAKVLLTLNRDWLGLIDIDHLINKAFLPTIDAKSFVNSNFSGIYFPDPENKQIDQFCCNLKEFSQPEADLMIYLMGQAMLMKRPYNLFHRANLDMRLKDVPRSFGNAKTWETSFQDHIKKLFKKLLLCQFSGPEGKALCQNTNKIAEFDEDPDLIYIDPPYLNSNRVAVDYSKFYHFLDGLVDYRLFEKGDMSYPYRPIALKPSNWQTLEGGLSELAAILAKWPTSKIAISYRGDGRPSIADIKAVLNEAGYKIDEHLATEYKYALSAKLDITEDLIIGTPAGTT